jgi:hypothetical protein
MPAVPDPGVFSISFMVSLGAVSTTARTLLMIPPEIAGTSGAFASASAIGRWGNNYSFFLTPIFFAFAGVSGCLGVF